LEQSRVLHRALLDELEKIGVDLTAQARTQIAKKNFALTGGQSNTGKPAYPIHDLAHARSALRLVGMHGSDQQKSEVRTDVERKYPALRKRAMQPGKLKNFISGAAHEAGPALGATLGAGLAKAYGVDTLAGAAAGYGLGSLHDVVHGIRHRTKTP